MDEEDREYLASPITWIAVISAAAFFIIALLIVGILILSRYCCYHRSRKVSFESINHPGFATDVPGMILLEAPEHQRGDKFLAAVTDPDLERGNSSIRVEIERLKPIYSQYRNPRWQG